MNKLAYIFIGFCFIFLCACQSENKKPRTNNSDPKDNAQSVRTNPDNNINISALRAQALSILDHRIKEDATSYAIIEAGCWEYEFIFDGEMSKPGDHAGKWIDFKPDFTYEYGSYNTKEGAGRYHYDFEKLLLLLVDNDEDVKPQEWNAKNSGDVMILVGTPVYQNNSVQMKLGRLDNCPTQ